MSDGGVLETIEEEPVVRRLEVVPYLTLLTRFTISRKD